MAVAAVAAVQIFVSDPGAAVAGSFVEQAELLGHGAGFGGEGGIGDHAVGLSADGNTALVGAPDGSEVEPSYTSIFTRSSSVWSPPTSLVGEIQGGEKRVPGGAGVALSTDGSTALATGGGGVLAFTREGATWRSTASIESPRETACGEHFGRAVAMSEDGNTAIVGDDFGCPEGFDGSAWIYARSGKTWTLQAGPLHGEEKINPFGNEADFASTVALSGDGNPAIVGADGEDGGRNGAGGAWVYKRSGSTWTQDGPKLTPPGGQSNHFGRSVALSGDGARALIGTGDEGNEGDGAWIFDRGPSGWTAQARFTSGEPGAVSGAIGWTVALSHSGNTALVGGPETSEARGEAWAFRCAATSWIPEPILPPVSIQGGDFGYSVALAGDGAAALISEPGGAPTVRAHGESEREGAAFVFSGPPDSPGFCAGALKPPGGPAQSGASGKPVVESLTQTYPAWREGRALASLARRRIRSPVGTTFEFSLNEPARVHLRFARLGTGHVVHGRCVRNHPHGHRGRRCRLSVGSRTLTLAARSGPSRLRFQGHLSKRDRLPSGLYTLTLTAEAKGETSTPRHVSFRILG